MENDEVLFNRVILSLEKLKESIEKKKISRYFMQEQKLIEENDLTNESLIGKIESAYKKGLMKGIDMTLGSVLEDTEEF